MPRSARHALPSALLALGFLVACGPGGEPRRDLLLILAEAPPAPGSSPTFERLLETGLVLRGPLRRADDPLATPEPLALRVELFTGRHDTNHVTSVWPNLPSLPEAARLSGRRALGFTGPGGITAEAGFDEFVPPGRAGGLLALADPAGIPAAITTALDGFAKRDTAAELSRASLLILCDLGSGPMGQAALEPILGTLETAALLEDAFVMVLFTDPDASLRAVVRGAGLPRGERAAAVDPRDLFPTLARLGRIPIPGVLQGRDLFE